mgnify:CR=1 FL=1|tara:strand:- start:92013 stop:93368 length:1356 start_codon:yes stop_codon:yes gene_type:complete
MSASSSVLIDHRCLDSVLGECLDAPRWLVGFSGGVDSTALLHLLQRWRRAHSGAPPLAAIHINHAMQSSADDWQVHCDWICKFLQIPLIARQVTVQGTSEAAAREARYAVFEGLVEPGDMLFLGHHLDDQVETFFLRLMRGSGVRGLAAMAPTRALAGGQLVRPLLQVTRAQLEDYTQHHGLRTIEDPSNADTAMDRNFLRHQLLPVMARRWPGYRDTVLRASTHMAVANAALEEALPAPATIRNSMGDPGVAVAELSGASFDAACLKLRHWLQRQGCDAPDKTVVEEFIRQLRESSPQAAPRLQCRTYALQRYQDVVYLLPEPREEELGQQVLLVPGGVADVPGVGRLSLEPTSAHGLLLPRDATLRVVWRQGGERCRPVGRPRGTTLKKLLQEADIPPWWRHRVPLLEWDGQLLAIGDLWACQSDHYRAAAPPAQPLWHLCWQRHTNAA